MYVALSSGFMALLAGNRCVRSGEGVRIGVASDVIAGGLETTLFVTVQTRRVAAFKLTTVRISVTTLTLAWHGSKLLHARSLRDRMASGTLKIGVGAAQRIRPGVVGRVKPRGLEMALVVAILA